jgi:hypothetical protein
VTTETQHSWPANAACLGLLALAVASFFPQVVWDGGVFFVQDMMVQNVPFRHFLHEALADWRLPLWEPRINAGFPLYAEGQVGALYPPNWVGAALLSPSQAVTWSVLLHLWLAAAGSFLYLHRGLGTGRGAALTAGLSYGLSGYLVVRAMSPNFVAAAAGIPYLFLLIETGLRRRQPAVIGAAGFVFALQLLAGHPQVAAYAAVAAFAYGTVRTAQLGQVRVAVMGAGIAVPGATIAAIQLLPTMELAGLSLRAGGIGYDQFVNMSLPPERLLTLLLPELFGNSAHGSYWGDLGGTGGFFIQLCPYVGVLTLLLAVVGAIDHNSTARGYFVMLATLGLALSLGRFTGFFELLHEVPLLRQFRIPTRFLIWWAFAAAVLSGLGVDRLVRDLRPLRAPWRAASVLLALIAIGVPLAMALDTERTARGLLAAQQILLDRWRMDLYTDVWRAMLVLLVAVVLFSHRFRRHGLAPVLTGVACFVVIWADLRSFGADFNGALAEVVYSHRPASAEAIHADDTSHRQEATPAVPAWGRFRVAGLISEHNSPYDWHAGWARTTDSYERYPATLRMYSAGLFGLANTLPGWSPLHLLAHWEFSRGYPAWLAMANVRYLVSHGALPEDLAEPVHASQVTVSRLRSDLPRAWVVPEAVILPEGESRLRYMRSQAFDPKVQVVLDRPPALLPPAGTTYVPARIAEYEAERVTIDLPGRDGYLILADTQAPGWQARVDGDWREIIGANHVFRAVPVFAADKRVQFSYHPRSVTIGAWISGCAVVLWLVASGMGRNPKTGSTRKEADFRFLLPLALQLALVIGLYGMATQTGLWGATLDRLRPGLMLHEVTR